MTFSPASEEVFEKIKAPEGIPLRRFEPVKWLRTRSGTRTVLRSKTENFN